MSKANLKRARKTVGCDLVKVTQAEGEQSSYWMVSAYSFSNVWDRPDDGPLDHVGLQEVLVRFGIGATRNRAWAAFERVKQASAEAGIAS